MGHFEPNLLQAMAQKRSDNVFAVLKQFGWLWLTGSLGSLPRPGWSSDSLGLSGALCAHVQVTSYENYMLIIIKSERWQAYNYSNP